MSERAARARRSRGAALIEYVLLLALFTLVAIPGIAKLKEGTASQARNTQTKLGGTPAATTPPPTTRPPITTTTAPPSFMVVNAGPDARVAPGTRHTQAGSATSPGNAITSTNWSITGSGTGSITSQGYGAQGGNAENKTSEYHFTATRPGRYYLNLRATNQTESKTDFAEVKVTSGRVSTTLSPGGRHLDATNTTWEAWTDVRLRNQFGQQVDGVTVSFTWTLSDGRTTSGTCVTSGGSCRANFRNLAAAVTWAELTVTALAWECLDSHDPFPAPVRQNKSALPIVPPPTTTTRPPATTTTVPPATTTTVPPATTTLPPPTTKRPNG